MRLISKSAKETKKFAIRLARDIVKLARGKHAFVISLEGELGAGKTTFTQGVAGDLGIRETIQSPTFVILKRYSLRRPTSKLRRWTSLIHVDAYRLRAKDFKVLGWKEFIKNSQNIILVEWGNKIKNILPKKTIRIIFKHGKKSNKRLISIT